MALLLLGLLAGVLLLVISPGIAEHFVFFPSRADPGPAPVLSGVEGEDVRLETSDGVEIHGWWFSSADEAPAVLLLHGNAGTIAMRTPLAEAYLDRGISIFMLDYRGYGRSQGSPSEEGVNRDAEAALDFVVERTGSPQRVVLHGRSVGGAVAARVARDRQSAGVILESTFTSLDEIAAEAYGILPSFLFRRLRGHFDALSAVRRISAPILVVHGTADTLIPTSMGLALHEAAREPRRWYGVSGAGHNDVHLVGGAEYYDELARFVGAATDESGGAGNGPVR